jgi:hypothetical protein
MTPHENLTPTDEREETHPSATDDDGVDVTLIRWMLSLDPSERLRFLEGRIQDILTVRALNSKV